MSPMIYTSYGFAIFFFIFWCGKWLIHILAISYGKIKLHRKTVLVAPPKTLAKPQNQQNSKIPHVDFQKQTETQDKQKPIQQADLLDLQQADQQQQQKLLDHHHHHHHHLHPLQQSHAEQEHQLESRSQSDLHLYQLERIELDKSEHQQSQQHSDKQQVSLDQHQQHDEQNRSEENLMKNEQILKLPQNEPQTSSLPSISILKPLMGIDTNLQNNLETFFTMNYHSYELLFCIESDSDPAVELVEGLIKKYPTVDTRLFIGGSSVGVNPKINNMNPGYEAAKNDFIMISDSGIRMKEDTLLDMVEHMTERVGLVHQMPFTCDREGFAATFEKIFFGTVQSRIYLCADLLGINCHTGMSCLMRKSVLDELGGLKSFGCYLAEDFFIAQAYIDLGWKLAVSSQPAWQNSGVCDISTFQARLTRWAKLRVAMVPTMILLEPMSECMIVGALASWSVSLLFHWDALVFYLVHILMWLLSDWLMLSIVQNGSLPFNKFEFVVGWLLRECSGPYLFFNALWNPAIIWREREFKLAWGGVAYETSTSMKNCNDKQIDNNISAKSNRKHLKFNSKSANTPLIARTELPKYESKPSTHQTNIEIGL